MKPYLDLLKQVLETGAPKGDRTGTGTLSVFGPQIKLDLRSSFPLVTTKYVKFHNLMHELLWFLKGSTNIAYLHEHNVHIWDAWADSTGNVGRIYGAQWVDWQAVKTKVVHSWSGKGIVADKLQRIETFNQVAAVVERIKTNPDCRRLIVSAWNPGELDQMSLPPCPVLMQFYALDGYLSCKVYQRSADMFIGVPYDIAQYALLTYMIAHCTGLTADQLIFSFGDCHIYNNHIAQVQEQLTHEPKRLPNLVLNSSITDVFEFTEADILLKGYESYPYIKGALNV